MLDNFSVAILNNVNELARRYEIDVCDFVAVVDWSPDAETQLRFESTPEEPMKAAAFERMLRTLGTCDYRGEPRLCGEERQVWEAVQSALARAPKRRTRG